MENENPPRTLGDYSRPSHKGYRNTIELPDGNNVVPLQSDTIRLVQNGCESLSKAWTHFKDLLQKVPHHGIDLWLKVQIFYDHVNPTTRRTIDQSADGKLHDKNAKESRALIEDLALYDNESQNDPRDFAKPVKAICLPHDVPNASDRRLIELENQVQHLMKALDPKPSVQVNKIASSLADGTKPYPIGIVRNVVVDVGKLKLLEDFYIIDMEKDPTCPLFVGRGFLATASAVIDCKKAKIAVGEGLTGSIFGVKEIDLGVEDVPYWTT
ncbi:MAK10-like protein [Tanacetum coccineum]